MGRATKVLSLKAHAPIKAQAHCVGRIVGVRDGQWLVDFPGNPHQPLVARSIVHLDREAMEHAAATETEALLLLEDDRLDLPIVVGLLTPASQNANAVGTTDRVEAMVDGKRVLVEAEDEIVLRCGEASITLRRNGRVVVRGTYVETRSQGVNRIKGGAVQIN